MGSSQGHKRQRHPSLPLRSSRKPTPVTATLVPRDLMGRLIPDESPQQGRREHLSLAALIQGPLCHLRDRISANAPRSGVEGSLLREKRHSSGRAGTKKNCSVSSGKLKRVGDSVRSGPGAQFKVPLGEDMQRKLRSARVGPLHLQ